MRVIKRNGAEVDFHAHKIEQAIHKASLNAPEQVRLTAEEEHACTQQVEEKCAALDRAVSVEEIQDMVEYELMARGHYDVARLYVRYRFQRSLVRKANTTDDRILSLIECNNEEVIQENANKNPIVNSVQRDYMAGEVSRDLTARLLLPKEIVDADRAGIAQLRSGEPRGHAAERHRHLRHPD